MASLNKVMIIGNLGRDPEVKEFESGQKHASFSVAVTEKYTDKQGQKQEKTEWVNIVFWGKQSEICEKYLKKGSAVYVEGKLSTKTWEDKSGVKKSKVEVIGSVFTMLSGKSSSSQDTQADDSQFQEEDLPF